MQQQDRALAASTLVSGAANDLPAEVAELFARVEPLLQEGQTERALDLLARSKVKSTWVSNALGVCQMRLDNAKIAVDLYRGMVLTSGGLVLRSDVPKVFKTNYAAALVLTANVSGAQTVLSEVNDESNPAVKKLREAIRKWEKSMGFWKRLNWWTGGTPDHPLTLDFPPGDLR